MKQIKNVKRSIAKLKEEPIKYKEFREKDIKYRKELKEKKEHHSKRVLDCAGSHVYEINTWLWNFGWWTFGRENRRDSQTFQVRNVPARLEDLAGPEACSQRGGVQLK
jgi:hypothetical protein